MTAKLTTPQVQFLDHIRRYPTDSFPFPNATMKALLKKGVIEVESVRKSPSGTTFRTYRQVT